MTDDQRPHPDALLAQIQQDEQREGRGRLRIYFGSSAGSADKAETIANMKRRLE